MNIWANVCTCKSPFLVTAFTWDISKIWSHPHKKTNQFLIIWIFSSLTPQSAIPPCPLKFVFRTIAKVLKCYLLRPVKITGLIRARLMFLNVFSSCESGIWTQWLPLSGFNASLQSWGFLTFSITLLWNQPFRKLFIYIFNSESQGGEGEEGSWHGDTSAQVDYQLRVILISTISCKILLTHS